VPVKTPHVSPPVSPRKQQPVEAAVQTSPISVASGCFDFAARIKQLEEENEKVQREKIKGMQFCVSQMEEREMKKQMGEKDVLIANQQKELQELRERLAQQLKDENKLQQLLLSSKQVLVQGIQNLSSNINQGFNQGMALVNSEFKNDQKQWVVVDRMAQLVSEIKIQLANVFADEQPRLQQPNQLVDADEQRQLDLLQKASLEAYREMAKQNQQEEELIETAKRLSLEISSPNNTAPSAPPADIPLGHATLAAAATATAVTAATATAAAMAATTAASVTAAQQPQQQQQQHPQQQQQRAYGGWYPSSQYTFQPPTFPHQQQHHYLIPQLPLPPHIPPPPVMLSQFPSGWGQWNPQQQQQQHQQQQQQQQQQHQQQRF